MERIHSYTKLLHMVTGAKETLVVAYSSNNSWSKPYHVSDHDSGNGNCLW